MSAAPGDSLAESKQPVVGVVVSGSTGRLSGSPTRLPQISRQPLSFLERLLSIVSACRIRSSAAVIISAVDGTVVSSFLKPGLFENGVALQFAGFSARRF